MNSACMRGDPWVPLLVRIVRICVVSSLSNFALKEGSRLRDAYYPLDETQYPTHGSYFVRGLIRSHELKGFGGTASVSRANQAAAFFE